MKLDEIRRGAGIPESPKLQAADPPVRLGLDAEDRKLQVIRQTHDAAGGNVVRFDGGDTLIFVKLGYSNPAFITAFSECAMREFTRLQLMPRGYWVIQN
ncbi:MAG: hypothetical protein OXI01_22885 [Albidovulum sp.]|nr:hypothetical protein [Albidovulum sp.]